MPQIIGHRIWLTADGTHVLDGDPRAHSLAYAAGDEVPDDIAAAVLTDPPQAEGKQAPPAEDKQAPAPANKSRARA